MPVEIPQIVSTVPYLMVALVPLSFGIQLVFSLAEFFERSSYPELQNAGVDASSRQAVTRPRLVLASNTDRAGSSKGVPAQ